MSTQRVEGIHRWAKWGPLTERKTFYDVFDTLMVIVGDVILKWERLDTRVTTGFFSSRHETAQQIFPMPYEAMGDRLTTWGSDEAAHQMVVPLGYDMKRLPDCAYEALVRPASDNCPDSTRGMEDLLEFDLPPTMVTPPRLMHSSLKGPDKKPMWLTMFNSWGRSRPLLDLPPTPCIVTWSALVHFLPCLGCPVSIFCGHCATTHLPLSTLGLCIPNISWRTLPCMRSWSLCPGTWLGSFTTTMSMLVLVPWRQLVWKASFRRGRVRRHYWCAKRRSK